MEGLARVASPWRQFLLGTPAAPEQDKLGVATSLGSSSPFHLEQAEGAAAETPRHRQDWGEGASQTPHY